MSTVAWASSSADSSSVVPVSAAWCRAENLTGIEQREGIRFLNFYHHPNCAVKKTNTFCLLKWSISVLWADSCSCNAYANARWAGQREIESSCLNTREVNCNHGNCTQRWWQLELNWGTKIPFTILTVMYVHRADKSHQYKQDQPFLTYCNKQTFTHYTWIVCTVLSCVLDAKHSNCLCMSD